MKSGEFYNDNEYSQLNTSGFGLASGTTAERPTPAETGMTRYNTDTDRVEVYTTRGWLSLAVDSDIQSSGSNMKDSITEKIRAVKKMTTAVIHIQGGSGSLGCDNLTSTSSVTPPGWLDSYDSLSFTGLQNSRGLNYMAFTNPAPSSRYTGAIVVDVADMLGVSDDRYSYQYIGFGGVMGYGCALNRNKKIVTTIAVNPNWKQSPDETTDKDTDLNYGVMKIDISYGMLSQSNHVSQYGLNFIARKFKNI